MTIGTGASLGAALIDALTTEANTAGGHWPDKVEQASFAITGLVQTGPGDIRHRGDGHNAPLHIDGSMGNWTRMRDAWEAGDTTADHFEDWFEEDVICEDIGEGSGGWEFPGDTYRVDIS